MQLDPYEFIRRVLLHVSPKGFHRIRYYGLLAGANRAESIATARALLGIAPPAADQQKQSDVAPDAPRVLPCPCLRCGARAMRMRSGRRRTRDGARRLRRPAERKSDADSQGRQCRK
jgi:hypothetical protein